MLNMEPGRCRGEIQPVRKQLPNQLTVLRLVLAALFFFVLNLYRYPVGPNAAIAWAIVIFICAGVTDFLDGYLARRWSAQSVFGRIMDPFCDKVLVIGAFIFLAGPRFVVPHVPAVPGMAGLADDTHHTLMVTGVYPWMVALILARELLVTGIRGELESQGVAFGANIWGKLKTVLQLIAIPFVLLFVILDPQTDGHHWLAIVRDLLVWAVVLVTVFSGVPYITSAARSMRAMRRNGD